jgi:phosphate transport system ATP-binding protein
MSIIEIKNLSLFYGKFQALKNISMEIQVNKITALIGPSGCGKSTFLRALNRMNDLIENVSTSGEVYINGQDIYRKNTDLLALRRKVGIVFQRPNPFPLSIFNNVAYGWRVHGGISKNKIKEKVKWALCIARLLCIEPTILLMDEPCSALDPESTLKIEKLMYELKKQYTIVIVTHNMQQAARVSDFTGYFLLGELIEIGETNKLFTNPKDSRTEDYITGRFG